MAGLVAGRVRYEGQVERAFTPVRLSGLVTRLSSFPALTDTATTCIMVPANKIYLSF